MKKKLLIFFGIILVFLGLFGVNYSINASRAQALYAQSRYSQQATELSPENIYSNYLHAKKLYPWNFYFSAYTGETFFYSLSKYKGDDIVQHNEFIKDIASHGLKTNPYNTQLIYLNMRMLQLESPKLALEYWLLFVDWCFWNGYNHSVLAELYAKSGMYENALNELKYLEKSPKLLDHTKHLVDDAWLQEIKQPPVSPDTK